MKVLLIDDSETGFLLLKETLTDASGGAGAIELEWAERLADGLEKLEAGGFDVALLDLGLPDSWGVETLQRYQARCPNVPVVALTGNDSPALIREILAGGAMAYLHKGDLDVERLPEVLRDAIARHRGASPSGGGPVNLP